MDQEKVGKFIKKVRKDNNLTQKEFADKYGVTYQAVSKWENGKNLPDITLLKQISKDFNININDLLEGEYQNNNLMSKKVITLMSFILFVLVLILIIILFIRYRDDNFEFKTLTTSCESFKISGSIAYNSKKSSIYISGIEYCGDEDEKEYKKIECTLYEKDNDIEKVIDKKIYDENKPISLTAFLEKVSFKIDDYNKVCNKHNNDGFYLKVNISNDFDKDKIISYEIPLTMKDSCIN